MKRSGDVVKIFVNINKNFLQYKMTENSLFFDSVPPFQPQKVENLFILKPLPLKTKKIKV